MCLLMNTDEPPTSSAPAAENQMLGRQLLTQSEGALDQMTPDRFVSMLAHDLRSPLSSIIGYAEVLLEGYFGPLTDEQAEQVRIIHASARRVADLIALVSDAFKVTQGQLALNIQPLDVRQVLHNAVTELTSYLVTRDQTFHIIGGDRPHIIPADQERLQAALTLLLRFAAQQSPPHSAFDIHIVPSPDGKGTLTLIGHVTSSETNTKRDPVELRLQSTLPLPLAIARMLIQAHGGRLTWSSPETDEDILRVELPVASTMLSS